MLQKHISVMFHENVNNAVILLWHLFQEFFLSIPLVAKLRVYFRGNYPTKISPHQTLPLQTHLHQHHY